MWCSKAIGRMKKRHKDQFRRLEQQERSFAFKQSMSHYGDQLAHLKLRVAKEMQPFPEMTHQKSGNSLSDRIFPCPISAVADRMPPSI